MTFIVKTFTIAPKCNKELKEKDMCAIIGHVSKSCRYCHTDIERIRQEIKENIL